MSFPLALYEFPAREEKTMRVVVDTDRCIAAGQCVRIDPDVFDQDDDGIVALLVDHSDPSQQSSLQLAVSSCPSGAIELLDEED